MKPTPIPILINKIGFFPSPDIFFLFFIQPCHLLFSIIQNSTLQPSKMSFILNLKNFKPSFLISLGKVYMKWKVYICWYKGRKKLCHLIYHYYFKIKIKSYSFPNVKKKSADGSPLINFLKGYIVNLGQLSKFLSRPSSFFVSSFQTVQLCKVDEMISSHVPLGNVLRPKVST